MSVTPPLESLGFPSPRQYLAVSAGSSAVVWELAVTGGYVAFLDSVHIKWFEETWLELIVDGVSILGRIEYEIATIDNPQKFNPPYVAHTNIRVVAHNDDSNAHYFECFLNGVLSKPKT